MSANLDNPETRARLAKRSQELYRLTNRLIEDVDNSEDVDECPHIEELY